MKRILTALVGLGIVSVFFFIGSNNESMTKETPQNTTSFSSTEVDKNLSLHDLNSKELEVSEKYQKQLQEININADRKLEMLIEQVKKEYTSKKKINQDITNISKKYKAILEHDERLTKKEFETVYQNLETEIKSKVTHRTLRKEFIEGYELKRIERRVNFENELENLG
jgi:hypothetical protein